MKSVFSKRDSNSKITDGEIDHVSLESDLSDNFETQFTPSYRKVDSFIFGKNRQSIDLRSELLRLTRYGIAGIMRAPSEKEDVDKAMKTLFFEVFPSIMKDDPKMIQGLKDLEESLSRTSYTNAISYSNFADSVLEQMGEVFFIVFALREDNHFFLLPDKPSMAARARINGHFNPDIKDYAQLQFPLSSKLFLQVESRKLRNQQDKIIYIDRRHSETLDRINTDMLKFADHRVVCESKRYLQDFTSKQPEE